MPLLAAGCAATTSEPPAGETGDPAFTEAAFDGAPVDDILWIGAHPDDEVSVAPLLASVCHQPGVACHFLVLTDGGKGGCALGPGACGVTDEGGAAPGTLGAFRLAELAESVAYFAGSLRALALEDSGAATVLGTLQRWNQTYSQVPHDASIAVVVQRVAQAILDSHADVILTFDPRHGMYCHPDHRAAGALALLAAQQVGFDPSRILMEEMTSFYLDASGDFTMRSWVPSDPDLLRYDAHATGTWPAEPEAMSFHQSQFTSTALALVAGVPAAAQQLPFLQASSALVDGQFRPSPYDDICASEAVWDGRGICPNAAGGVGPCW